MTTFGRILVVVLVAGVLVGGTLLATHWVGSGDPAAAQPAPAGPPAPVMIETPPVELPPSPQPSRPKEEGRISWFDDYRGPRVNDPDKAAEEATEVAPPEEPAPVSPGPAAPGPAQPEAAGDPPTAPAPEGTAEGARLASEGLAYLGQDRLVEAQRRLSEALKAGVGGEAGRLTRKGLNELADRIQFSKVGPPDAPHVKKYTVESGDYLSTIASKFLIPYPLIQRINGLPDTSIRAGQQLKLLDGPIHVTVFKGAHELQAWLGDVCVRVYPVGIGANDSTPVGTFIVLQKLRNPPYQPQHKPHSAFREGGAPDNPLGTRWIDLGNHYGIHGTIEPASIGRSVSEGCIRMHNRDVEELFDLVAQKATKVEIRP